MKFISKDAEFLCASFDTCQKFAASCPLTQTPTQIKKHEFLRFSSQEMGSSLVSLVMIFKALQSELFRFKFCTLTLKILKIPEFNLVMAKQNVSMTIRYHTFTVIYSIELLNTPSYFSSNNAFLTGSFASISLEMYLRIRVV